MFSVSNGYLSDASSGFVKLPPPTKDCIGGVKENATMKNPPMRTTAKNFNCFMFLYVLSFQGPGQSYNSKLEMLMELLETYT